MPASRLGNSPPVPLLGVFLFPLLPTAGRTFTLRAGILFTTASSPKFFMVSRSFNPLCLACLVAWPPVLGFSWFPSPMTGAQLVTRLALPVLQLTPLHLGAGHKQWPLVALPSKQKRKRKKKKRPVVSAWLGQCSLCLSTAPPSPWLEGKNLLLTLWSSVSFKDKDMGWHARHRAYEKENPASGKGMWSLPAAVGIRLGVQIAC